MKSLHAIVEELDVPLSLLRSLTIKCHLLKGEASQFKCYIFFFYKTKKIKKKYLYIPKNISKTKKYQIIKIIYILEGNHPLVKGGGPRGQPRSALGPPSEVLGDASRLVFLP